MQKRVLLVPSHPPVGLSSDTALIGGPTSCASACSSILDVDGCLVYNTTGNPSPSGGAPAAIRPGIENHASVALRTPAADCSPGQAESRSQACCVVNARTGIL